MERKTFPDKVKKLMELYWTGVDVSEIQNLDELFELGDDYSYEYTVEHGMVQKIKEGIEPLLYDSIAPIRGEKMAQKITLEMEDRIDFMEHRFKSDYEKNEDKARVFDEKVDAKAPEWQTETSEQREQVTSQLKNTIEQEQKEKGEKGKIFEKELTDYLYGIQKTLDIYGLTRVASDTISEYVMRNNKIAQDIQTALSYVYQDAEREWQVDQMTSKCQLDVSKLYEQLQNGEEFPTQEMEPAQLGIQMCLIKRHGEHGEQESEKGILISKAILDKALAEENEKIFDLKTAYQLEERKDHFMIFSQEEVEKIETLGNRWQAREQEELER